MIAELKPGEPIDYTFMSKLVQRVNQLDAADNLSAIVSRNSKYVSTDKKIAVQAFRQTRKLTRDAAGYYGNIGAVNFPTPFADVPVVTVTFDSCTYMVPYITSVGTSGFQLSGLRTSASNADVPTTVYVNVIAVGAAKT